MQSDFQDRVLTCVDCRGQFIFTAGEQIFFLDKQFKNDPKRCKPCKAKRAAVGARAGGAAGSASTTRTETRTECSECHIETTVPFKPTQGRPVLCRQCFQGKRTNAVATASAIFESTTPPAYEVGTVNAVSAVSVEAATEAILQPQA
jgi:CxxC-x17-CxxC domain-containing protein